MSVTLKQLVAAMPALKVEGSLDREVLGITYDSRRVTPGMVFVAIPGLNVDGHEFIPSAIDRGAAAVVCEKNGFSSSRTTKIKVSDARVALAQAASAFYQNPSAKLRVIGVTGTNGKTTVSFMVKQILEAAEIRCGLIGTVRYEIGDRVIPAQRTTPEALEIQQLLSQMNRANCAACVMEVSSHALEQHRVDTVDFEVVVFTNLTQDHLDYHRSMEDYFLAKKKLFQNGSSRHRTAIINVDDSFGRRLSSEASVEMCLGYGIDQPATFKASGIQLGRERTQFTLETADARIAFDVPLIGRHNVYNALAAIGTALALKVPVETIRRAMNTVQPVPGRLESVSCGQPFGLFVDYAHTDDALRNILATVRELKPGRILLAFGCGGSRDPGKRAKMGKVAAELADVTILTSDNPRKEDPQSITRQIEEGYREVRTTGYRVELDRRRAIDEIVRAAEPGDIVIIAGKGHETYQEFEDTVVPFDDRVYATETLENLGFRARDNK